MKARPYPWYYTVNDRPAMIDSLPDGGADCYVFDFASGDLVVERAYLSDTLPGSGKDVEQLTEEEFGRVPAWRCKDVLHRWAERVCLFPGGSPAQILEAVGVDRALVPNGTAMEMNPPPLGADKVMVSGSAAYIDVRLPEGPITRAHLDARFGTGSMVPRLGASHPQLVAYEVRVSADGVQGRCTVFAHFRHGTEDAAPASAVVLRGERAERS